MKKKVLIFFLVLFLSISLSSAVKTITVNETDLVSLKPQARDDDADQLFYTFSEPLDEQGKWQTGYGDAGEYTITITVSDGQSSASQDVLLVVNKKNLAPVIGSFVPKESALEIDEGHALDFNIQASDRNNDQLSYEWLLDNNIVSQQQSCSYYADYGNAGTHKISVIVSDGEAQAAQEWTVKVNKVERKALLDSLKDITIDEGDAIKLNIPDFKKYNLDYTISEPIGNDNYWETGYGDDGIYDVKITIEDREFSASKTIKITVNDKDRPPVLKPIANAWLKEGQKVTIELEVNDPDNDNISISAENMPDGAALKENKFEWVIGYDTVKKEDMLDKTLDKFHLLYKSFKITFIAKSKELQSKQSISIMVKDVNRPPILKEPQNIIINEGEEVIISPEADDLDGDPITYSYSGWIDMDRYATNYDDAGTYKVKVTASDGFLTDEKYLTIEVKDVNRPPVFNEIGKIEINENEKLELPLYAADPDGDSVEISSGSLPKNSSMEENIFKWAPDYDAVKTGSAVFTITFIADDGSSITEKQVNITVYNVNQPPKITAASQKDITLKQNQKVKFEVVAEDLDGDRLAYLWKFSLLEQYESGPAMIRKFTSPGNKKVTVVVSDGKDESAYGWNVKVV